MSRALLSTATVLALVTLTAACGSDDDGGADGEPAATDGGDDAPVDTTTDPTDETTSEPAATDGAVDDDSGDGASPGVADVVAGEPFPDDRCAANEAAGTVTFLTGFDFAAAASIAEVLTADAAGYYDDVCLDVEILPGFSSANYPLVASGNAQFASGGSFSEVVNFANANEADFVVTSVDGREPIDTLIVKDGVATELSDLAGTTIGVKGKLPPSIEVMLLAEDLVEGDDFDTVLLDGFDPLAHIEQPIDGLPGWKSNEVGALQRAEVPVVLFDPIDSGVPGSFGVIFTSASFAAEHPTAATDFVRATARGLADAIDDPAATAQIAVDAITAGGNPNFLSPEGETFRWETEATLIADGTPSGVGYGTPDVDLLQAEVDAYAEVGLFGDEPVDLDAAGFVASDVIAGVHADGTVVWPG